MGRENRPVTIDYENATGGCGFPSPHLPGNEDELINIFPKEYGRIFLATELTDSRTLSVHYSGSRSSHRIKNDTIAGQFRSDGPMR